MISVRGEGSPLGYFSRDPVLNDDDGHFYPVFVTNVMKKLIDNI
jgi:hypothetical protein